MGRAPRGCAGLGCGSLWQAAALLQPARGAAQRSPRSLLAQLRGARTHSVRSARQARRPSGGAWTALAARLRSSMPAGKILGAEKTTCSKHMAMGRKLPGSC